MKGFWNSLWLGLKPLAQFLIGGLLFAVDKDRAGAVYTLLLVWTVGYSLCAILIDRQVVVLAQRSDATAASAVRALFLPLLGAATILAIAIFPLCAAIAGISLPLAFAIVLSGALGGISEACGWAVLASKDRYRVLATVRAAAVVTFVILAVWALKTGGQDHFAVPILAESLATFVLLFWLCRKEVCSAPRITFSISGIAGFWMLSVLVYLHQQFEFWWTTGALTRADLAAYRLGSAPRSFLLLGMSGILQPILFHISSRRWHERRRSSQQSALRATDVLAAINSLFVCVTVIAVLARPEIMARYGETLRVAWLVTACYAAFGWFGNLGSTLMTNHGAVKTPIIVILASIAVRTVIFCGLLWTNALDLTSLVVVTEAVSFLGQMAYWSYVKRSSIWVVGHAEKERLYIRAGCAVAAIAAPLAENFSGAGLYALLAGHLLIAVHAFARIAVNEPALDADIQLLENAA